MSFWSCTDPSRCHFHPTTLSLSLPPSTAICHSLVSQSVILCANFAAFCSLHSLTMSKIEHSRGLTIHYHELSKLEKKSSLCMHSLFLYTNPLVLSLHTINFSVIVKANQSDPFAAGLVEKMQRGPDLIDLWRPLEGVIL